MYVIYSLHVCVHVCIYKCHNYVRYEHTGSNVNQEFTPRKPELLLWLNLSREEDDEAHSLSFSCQYLPMGNVNLQTVHEKEA